jgi:hypothetical protein
MSCWPGWPLAATEADGVHGDGLPVAGAQP